MTKKLYSDMAAAFWDYLGTRQDYLDLGLSEWRRYDGRTFEPESPEEVNFSDLPAFYCGRIQTTSESLTQPAGFNMVTVTLDLGILYDAAGSSGAQVSDALENALATIYEGLWSQDAVRSHLKSNGVVSSYDLTIADVEPLYARPNDRDPAFWHAQMTVALRRSR